MGNDSTRRNAGLTLSLMLVLSGASSFGRTAAAMAMAAAAPRPIGTCDDLIRLGGRNGHVPLEEYEQLNDRTLDEYRNQLNGLLDRRLPTASWLDNGSGYALALLEAVGTGRARFAVAINPQDGLSRLRARDHEWFIQHRPFSHVDALIRFVGGARPNSLKSSIDAAAAHLNALEAAGRFAYLTGFSEVLLPNLDRRFTLVTDVFGAFFYSPDRVRLLAEYYAHLDSGGEALVVIRGRDVAWLPPDDAGRYREIVDEYGPDDFVRLPDGRVRRFAEYLVDAYPSVFSIRTKDPVDRWASTRHDVLVIRRDPRVGLLTKLNTLAVESVTYDAGESGGQIPSVTYTSRDMK